ncbi:agmatinase [Pontivivens insulae]|uniref:Agmatinase n=1 Tax=Pontivivens insulae TaxID=1639689 RepID=A0A2R8A8G1_9RHOB|nr:agmatinase [Pontivivens insulae]RED18618.1 agmatinase [Pontivivens insulae]SPF28516.1 Agmatinase [Pontivivens insulae]
MDHRKDYAFLSDDPTVESHDENFYSGALSFCRRPYTRDVATLDVAVMGVPYDVSVTNRPGTRFGPRAVRAASSNLAWARAWPSSFDPFQRLKVGDWGDIHIDNGHPEKVPAHIEAAIASVLAKDTATLLIGGDHFTTYPSLKAHVAKHGPLALIQFDAHTDTWKDDGKRIDHGTMFYHAVQQGLIDPDRSIQVGIRTTNDDPMGILIRDAIEVNDTPLSETIAAIRDRVGDSPAYLTFDIDGLDPSCAPGTGTPVVGGLSTHQAMSILRGLHGLNIVGADVVEVSPPYDHAEITALAGATIALELLCIMGSRA